VVGFIQYQLDCLFLVYMGQVASLHAAVHRELSMLYDTRVTSLHEAVSFTGILPQGSLFPTLVRLLRQCIRLQYISSVIRLLAHEEQQYYRLLC